MGTDSASKSKSERMKLYFSDPNNRVVHSSRMKVAFSDVLVRKAISIRMKKLWKDKEYRQRKLNSLKITSRAAWRDLEYRKKVCEGLSKFSKRLWQNEEYRRKALPRSLSNFRQCHVDPKILAKRSVAAKKRWDNLSEKEKALVIERLRVRLGSNKPNKAELRLRKVLSRSFPGEYKLNTKGNVVIGGKIPDFVSTGGKKIVIELFGDYWHSERIKNRTASQEENHVRDSYARHGYGVAIVWEKELQNHDTVVSRIREQLECFSLGVRRVMLSV